MRHNLAWKKKKSSARPAKLLPLIPEKYHMMMPFMMMSSGVLFPPGPGLRGRPSRRAELAKKHLAGGRRQRFAEHVPLDAVATLLQIGRASCRERAAWPGGVRALTSNET